MKIAAATCFLGLACAVLVAGPAQTTTEVHLQIVKYDGLADAVLKNRGKVVLVDFWGNF